MGMDHGALLKAYNAIKRHLFCAWLSARKHAVPVGVVGADGYYRFILSHRTYALMPISSKYTGQLA